ncbi:MAG: deoxynucleoside kinase [Chloroherpetonaceae bacterium]
MTTEKKFIAVAGNMGAGKSTLVELLAKHYKWDAVLEAVDNSPNFTNPYLVDFFDDMSRWSFNLQVFFLTVRFKQHRAIQAGTRSAIQDRTIYEDAEIFARNLYEMNLMSERDFNTYQLIYNEFIPLLKPPDLVVYLQASIPKLVSNIEKRARHYESKVKLDYLKRLHAQYESWYARYAHGKKILINVDNLDFVERADDLNVIIERIERELFGLFA